MAVPVDVPACALARTNAMWLFARDRRLRGAAVAGPALLGLGLIGARYRAAVRNLDKRSKPDLA